MRRLLLLLPLVFIIPDQQGGNSSSETIKFNDDPKVKLVEPDEMEKLAKSDPVGFIENCLRRYKREDKGYTLTFEKQERINKKLQPNEVIAAKYRQEPFSVLLRWERGARMADAILYVEGQNQDKVDGQMKSMLLVHPSGVAGRLIQFVKRDPDGKEAKQSGRYTIKGFGLEQGMLLTWNSWKKAQKEDALHVEYLGVVNLKEAGDRPCYKLRRTQYKQPEEDGITELTIYVDKETWLQIGSELKGEEGKWIAKYYFRDIRLNPELKDETFKPEALSR
ncbi:MAG: DUF1571 domain-containing protein [Gemmataceae bacterium]